MPTTGTSEAAKPVLLPGPGSSAQRLHRRKAYVRADDLYAAAQTVRRRITPEMLAFFEAWRDDAGVRTA